MVYNLILLAPFEYLVWPVSSTKTSTLISKTTNVVNNLFYFSTVDL